jgi:hypothetical protein
MVIKAGNTSSIHSHVLTVDPPKRSLNTTLGIAYSQLKYPNLNKNDYRVEV